MIEKFLPKRLDIQVAIICGLMIILFVPAYVINKAQQEIEYVLEAVKQETTAVTKNIALTSIEALVTRDFASLENLLIQSAKFPGVIAIQITDPKGMVISDVVNIEGIPTPRFTINQFDIPKDNNSTVVLSSAGDELIISEAIISGSSIGWVRLHYALKNAQLHAEERFREYLIDAAILTVVLIGLLILFLRRPMRVIQEAADFAYKIINKTGEQMPVSHQSSELKKLSTALNNASADLHEQDNLIKQVLKDLETQKLALDEHSIVAITDDKGTITYANKKFLEVTGYSCEELIGMNPRIFNSGYHPPVFFQGLWDTISSGNIWRNEILNITKSGKRIWLSASIIPFTDENNIPYKYVLVYTDITPLKSIERQLERKNESLEDLTDHLEEIVHKRTEELELANEELIHLNKVKSDFVSVVSHELRTPLTSIKSFAEILEDDIGEMDHDTQRRYLKIINSESDRLGRLINDVLDLQKIDAGMMRWNDEIIDLNNLLVDTSKVFGQVMLDKGIELEIVSGSEVAHAQVDKDKITQVVTNILSNSLKFTKKGKVSIALSKLVEEDEEGRDIDWYQVSIRDTGAGIPEKDIDDIFKRFHQVDSSETREQGGSGLGLNICQEIIDHYNGHIWVESKLGEGSCFNFKLMAVSSV